YVPNKPSSGKGKDKAEHGGASNTLQQAFASIQVNSVSLANSDCNMGSVWLPDSGVTSHLTKDIDLLTNARVYDGTDKVMVGDGTMLPIEKTGNIVLDTNHSQFHLDDVLYVPTIKQNLLSISKFTKDNKVSVEFFEWGYEIKCVKTRKVLAEGKIRTTYILWRVLLPLL
ncbi:hypothetical protein MKX03_034053, partial [Papaver bracteatum]